MRILLTRARNKLPLLILMLLLTLPTPALAGALIGEIFPIAGNSKLIEVGPALAYNPDREEYLAVWWNDREGNDDIQAQRLAKSGQKLGPAFYIAASSPTNEHERRYPDVAYNPQHKQYLVVWENKDSTGFYSINGKRVSGEGIVIDQNDIEIRKPSTDTCTKPAIAYGFTSDLYLVAWAETSHTMPITHTIYGQLMNAQGMWAAPAFKISEGPDVLRNPDIAYNRHANRHLVVWEQDKINTDNKTGVKGHQVTGDGMVWESPILIADYTGHSRHPAAAAIPTSPGKIKFMVVFELEHSAGNHNILAKFYDEEGTLTDEKNVAYNANNETAPAVAGSEAAQEYLVMWREDIGILTKPIKARAYNSSGADLGVRHLLAGTDADFPAVVAGYRGDFLLAWQDTPQGTSDWNIYGALFGNRVYIPIVNH